MSTRAIEELRWILSITFGLCIFGGVAGVSGTYVFVASLLGFTYAYLRMTGEFSAKLFEKTDQGQIANLLRYISFGGTFISMLSVGMIVDYSSKGESVILALMAFVTACLGVSFAIFGLFWKSTYSETFRERLSFHILPHR